MTKSSKKKSNRPAGSTEPSGYDVGYGKPPKHTQFKSKQSGNLRGRPKGSKNKKTTRHSLSVPGSLLETLARSIRVREGDKTTRKSLLQVVLDALVHKGAKGDPRSIKMIIDELRDIDRQRKSELETVYRAAQKFKLDAEAELEKRDKFGLSGPEIIPHPNHIHCRPNLGEVRITGPVTKEERHEWYFYQQRSLCFSDRLACYQRISSKKPSYKDMQPWLDDLQDAIHIFHELIDDGRCYCDFHVKHENESKRIRQQRRSLNRLDDDCRVIDQLRRLAAALCTDKEAAAALGVQAAHLRAFLKSSQSALDAWRNGTREGIESLRNSLRSGRDYSWEDNTEFLLQHLSQPIPTAVSDHDQENAGGRGIHIHYIPCGVFVNDYKEHVAIPGVFPGDVETLRDDERTRWAHNARKLAYNPRREGEHDLDYFARYMIFSLSGKLDQDGRDNGGSQLPSRL